MARRRRVTIWLFAALAVVLGLPLLATLVGSTLPREHEARMVIELRSPPGRVWTLISSFADTPRWRSDVTSVKMETPSGGPVRFVETSRSGSVPFEVVLQDAPRRQVVRVVDDAQPFGGTWTWELHAGAEGTWLTLTEAGFVKPPLFRVMRKLFFRPSATIEAYLRDLAKALGESATARESAKH
jgi:uncharacterized protein YndB with AHSA1/START domain